MLQRLLKLIARKPLRFGCGCGSLLVTIVAAIIALIVARCVPGSEEEEVGADGKNPRLVLGRVWFDKLPDRRTDSIDLWIFFGGGIGIHENGSAYRASFDVFEFERQGSSLDGTYLHDKKKLKTSFDVRTCDDHPPFDLCLTLNDVGGKKVELYGFAYDEEMEKAVPGSKATFESAKLRGEGARK